MSKAKKNMVTVEQVSDVIQAGKRLTDLFKDLRWDNGMVVVRDKIKGFVDEDCNELSEVIQMIQITSHEWMEIMTPVKKSGKKKQKAMKKVSKAAKKIK